MCPCQAPLPPAIVPSVSRLRGGRPRVPCPGVKPPAADPDATGPGPANATPRPRSPTRGAARARTADGVVHCLVVQRNFILPEQVLAVLPAALSVGAVGDRVACPTIVHGEGNRLFAHPHPPLVAGGWPPAASRAHLQAVRQPHFEAKLQDVVAVLEKSEPGVVRRSVDAKPRMQALERTQTDLPATTVHTATRTRDHVRHGTLTLPAALDLDTRNSWPSRGSQPSVSPPGRCT